MHYSFRTLATLTVLCAALSVWCAGCAGSPSNSTSPDPEGTTSTSLDSETGSDTDFETDSDSHAERTDSEDGSGSDEETGTKTDESGTETEAGTESDSRDTEGSESAETDTTSETEAIDTDTGPDMSPEACRPYEGLEGDALLEALHESVRGHASQGYNFAKYLIFTDVDLVDGKVECIYSGRSIEKPHDVPSVGAPDYFNAEHSWPQSQFDFDEPARSDLNQLFAADTRVNNARSNYDFADGCPVLVETSCRWACEEQSIPAEDCTCNLDAGASRVIECQGDRRYEVRPERRGDIARAHFYMVARYRFDTSIAIDDDDKTTLGCPDADRCIDDDEEIALRRWHKNDPVDDRERTRNDRIELYQKNRNPFVDCPALVGLIKNF